MPACSMGREREADGAMTTKPKRKLDAYTLRWAAHQAQVCMEHFYESDMRDHGNGCKVIAHGLLAKAREIEKEADRG